MKYAAILFALLFAMTGPKLSADTEPDVPDVPEYVDITGIVLEGTEEGFVLDTEDLGEVFVHLTEETYFEGEEPVVGTYVHITSGGNMALSLPPQVTALKVGCYAYTGEITEMTEEYFMLDGSRRVNAEPEKLENLSVGITVTVYSNGIMTMSIPPQVYGEYIVPVE